MTKKATVDHKIAVSPKLIRSNAQHRRHRNDQEFLPAALEILETPPSPVRMALIVAIAALATACIGLSYVGRMEIVAVAQGKVQPTGRVKVVQPLETGRVQALRTENGAQVRRGDILVEIDPSELAAEEAGLTSAFASSQAEIIRRRIAILVVSETQNDTTYTSPLLTWEAGIPKSISLREERVLAADLSQLSTSLGSLAAQARQKSAERARLTETIMVQKELIATLKERVSMRTVLVEKNSGTKASLIDATESLQYQYSTLATQNGQLAETEAALDVIAHDMMKVRAVFTTENTQKVAEAERIADDLEQKLIKTRLRRERMILRSPLDGTIQSLSVTTIGQVVTVGEELMRIVPGNSVLEIEAYLPNRDAGFVRKGQETTIKIESLPFTRYGTLSGTIIRVGSDAIPEPDAQQLEGSVFRANRAGFTAGAQRIQNLVFPITVRMGAFSISADGTDIPLSPGMSATVEIKTGQRRIIEYIFSPLVEIGSQALRER